MLDRSLHLPHIHYAHHILPAFIIRSFPSPSLQRLPCSLSSYVRNETSKTADFIKLQVPALIFRSLPPLWCTPLFILLLISSPPFWWLRLTYSNAVRLYPSPLTHTHAPTMAPQYRERVGVLGFSVQWLCHCEVSSNPRGRHREHIGVHVQG